MMEASQTVPELVAAAQTDAKTFENRISDTQTDADDRCAAYIALETASVDTFTLFEARMQHHFKRGPFSRKLRAALLEAGHSDLADRIHQYYLAINVLKHGTGASYRELRDNPKTLFPVKRVEGPHTQEENAPSDLIDIGIPGFFDGMAATLLEAHTFLETNT